MARTISLKTVKASTSNLDGKPPPRDKTLGVEPEICSYKIEDGDKTEEVEEAEILVINDSSLTLYNQNLVKSRFHFGNIFDH